MARFAKSIRALAALMLAMAVPGKVVSAFVTSDASGDASAGSIQE